MEINELRDAAVVDPQEQNSTEALAHPHLREVARVTVPSVLDSPPSVPDAGTQSMLNGLTGLHSFVLAIDSELRVSWLRDDLGILARKAAESIGRPASELLDGLWPDDLVSFEEQTSGFVEKMLAQDKVTRAPVRLRLDGTALPLEVSAFPIRDSAGNDFVVCVADRHEPRESLEQKNEELENYVRSVSHDLRSSLVSLLGFSRLLRDDYDELLGQSGLHFLGRVEQAGEHMQQLLNDMLELSRIEHTPHCRVHVNPAQILRQLSSELKSQLDQKGIELRVPEDPPTILCDRTRLYQLLSNLIGNAIQHQHPEPTTTGRVDVDIEEMSDGWQISVRDNGPGIQPQDHARIFEAFQTACLPSDVKKSSGLGLAIVKKIVRAHSGRVWVESQPNTGSCFFVWLPKS